MDNMLSSTASVALDAFERAEDWIIGCIRNVYPQQIADWIGFQVGLHNRRSAKLVICPDSKSNPFDQMESILANLAPLPTQIKWNQLESLGIKCQWSNLWARIWIRIWDQFGIKGIENGSVLRAAIERCPVLFLFHLICKFRKMESEVVIKPDLAKQIGVWEPWAGKTKSFLQLGWDYFSSIWEGWGRARG